MPHLYWRIRSPVTFDSTGYVLDCAEVQFRSAIGGANVATGGVAISSSDFSGGFVAANAYDANTATAWNSAIAPLGGALPGQWIGYHFAAVVDIVEIMWQSRNGFMADPKDIYVDWSDDGIAWTNAWMRVNNANGAALQIKVFNTAPSTEERVTTADTLVALNYPATEERVSEADVLTAFAAISIDERVTEAAAEVALMRGPVLRSTEAAVLVAVRYGAQTHRIRAWTFTQDDHDFYVLGLGSAGTLVLDLMTNQWSMWNTEGRLNWRTSTGIDWDNYNIAGDLDEGIIWNIAAQGENVADLGRTDDFSSTLSERRPIISVVRGLLPIRLRNSLGCYRAVLSVSEGAPAADGVGITLRTSDDFARSWHSHGTLLLDDPDAEYDVQWSSLGQITAPGRIFEIEDTGYAWRIDALDVDLGPDEGKVDSGG
jgi:hypothetical protein